MFVGLERRGSFRRLFSIVEKHVQRELKCPCHPLQGFEAWYRIAVFYARDVAPQQSGRHPMTGANRRPLTGWAFGACAASVHATAHATIDAETAESRKSHGKLCELCVERRGG